MKSSIYKKIVYTLLAVFCGLSLQVTVNFAQDENPLVEALFKSAEKNADDGRLEAALAEYEKIIALAPDNADAFYGRGYIYLRQKDYDRAIRDFTRTLEIKPDDFYTFYSRGTAYFRKGDYENAIADHTSELELEPSRDLGQLGRGRAYLKLKQYDEAFFDFNDALVSSPSPAAYLARGLAFDEKGDRAGALGDLRYFLEEIPDDAKVRARLIELGAKPAELPPPLLADDKKIPAAARELFASAIRKLGEGDYPEAVYDLSAALRIYPAFAAAYLYRGYAQEIPGSLIYYRKIREDYTKAIALDPKFADAYLRRGYNEFYNTQSPKAMVDFNRAVALNPKSARALFYRGRSSLSEAKGLLDYNRALKLNPYYAEAYLQRAEIFEGKNQHEKALADYAAVLKINPNDARAYDERAKIYCKQGKKQLAEADEKKFAELGGKVDSPCGEK